MIMTYAGHSRRVALRPLGEETLIKLSIITVQPGLNILPAPGATWMQCPPSIHPIPPGLEYLLHLDTVQIYQLKERMPMFRDWEEIDRYIVRNSSGEQCYYAFEESRDRYCGGGKRGFVIRVVDNFKTEVSTIRRESISCGDCCCGCLCMCCYGIQQECTVESPTTGILGFIRLTTGCMTSSFDILDAKRKIIFHVDVPDCCTLLRFEEKEFEIRAAVNNQVMGSITNKGSDRIRDMFNVNFPINLDVKMKAVLLGATFAIGFISLEQPGNGDN